MHLQLYLNKQFFVVSHTSRSMSVTLGSFACSKWCWERCTAQKRQLYRFKITQMLLSQQRYKLLCTLCAVVHMVHDLQRISFWNLVNTGEIQRNVWNPVKSMKSCEIFEISKSVHYFGQWVTPRLFVMVYNLLEVVCSSVLVVLYLCVSRWLLLPLTTPLWVPGGWKDT